MMGNFKPNLNKHEHWNSKTFTSNGCEAFNTFLNYKGCFIDVKTIQDRKYYHTFEKQINTNLENQSPIYSLRLGYAQERTFFILFITFHISVNVTKTFI